VHIHSTFPLLSPSVVEACNDAAVPAVATLHNYTMVCPTGTLFRDGRICTDCVSGSPRHAVRHGCYRNSSLATIPLAVNLAVNRRRWSSGIARFFCISHAQRNLLIQAGMPAERLHVKANFVADPGEPRRGAGEHVLYLGRLTEEKGMRVLMTAWDRIAAGGGIGLPLVVAGAGPLSAELWSWSRGRADVHLLGKQTGPECARLLARSAAVVAPSVWLEAFGLVVVEAMAAGVPVIASAQGSFVELIDDGVTGLLFRPGDDAALADCLRQVVSDPDRNRAMGLAGRARYDADFTPEVGLERLIAGYEAAIAAPAGCEPL
jgi:glycosyltransferase involved in cell wall biosynthesis